MKKKKPYRRSLFSTGNYLIFFILISFTVTCCFLLFLNSMELDEQLLRENALATFINILFLSLLFTIIDSVRRKLTIERPVKRILEAANKITKGDFHVQIAPLHGPDSQNELDRIIGAFNQMARELSGVETLRTDFISNVSHELKTPLSVIQNYGNLLQLPDLSEEDRMEYARAITSSTQRLADLISNILKLNRLENQQIYPEARLYNLGEQLCECLLAFENAWESKQLEIETHIDEELTVFADAQLLSLVWNNLFSNAIKFTEPGGKISLSLHKERDCAVVTVTDTGCGIPPEIGAHIFEKFYQGDTSHAASGNGLGLALVRRVMDITGGEISVESVPGRGSTFTVRLRNDRSGQLLKEPETNAEN